MSDDRRDTLAAWAATCLGVPAVELREFLGGAGNLGYQVLAPGSETPIAFLRTKLGGEQHDNLGYSLAREGAILRVAAELGFPVAPVIGTHDEPDALLMGFVEGSSRADAAETEVVAPKYLALVARIHASDAGRFPVRQFATLGEAIAGDYAAWLAEAHDLGVLDDPLIALATRVLREHMPGGDGPPSLVHGDVGAGNFLTLHGEVSAVIDWELAHLGDPHEDLAWLWMRGAHAPFGDPQTRFAEYAAASGTHLEQGRLAWHVALVMWKSVLALHGRLRRAVPGELAMVQLIVALTYDVLLAAQLQRVLGGQGERQQLPPEPAISAEANLAQEVLALAPLAPDQRVVLEYLRDSAALGDWLRATLATDCRERLGVEPAALLAHVRDCPSADLPTVADVLAAHAERRALTSPKSVRRIERALTIGLGRP